MPRQFQLMRKNPGMSGYYAITSQTFAGKDAVDAVQRLVAQPDMDVEPGTHFECFEADRAVRVQDNATHKSVLQVQLVPGIESVHVIVEEPPRPALVARKIVVVV